MTKPTFTSQLEAILKQLASELHDDDADWGFAKSEAARLIKHLIAESLPEDTGYDDYEWGSHAEGWNSALNQTKQNLELNDKEAE